MSALELTVLRNIITNEKYMRKVLPFIKSSYFGGNSKLVFKQLAKFVAKYNRLPSKEAFIIELGESDIPDDKYGEVTELVPQIFAIEPVDEECLLDKTEKWCQDRALELAIMEAVQIIDGKSEKFTKNSIPELLTDALAVSFDNSIGHDYFEDMEKRFAFYTEDHPRIPFDLELFNTITGGGLFSKTLTIALAGTGVGKSLFMCHMAAASLLLGYDVLYITMEMSEEKIAQRIDANLLDIPINKIEETPRDLFTSKIGSLKLKTQGRLIIKEYPTGGAHSGHFRALLNDLKLKKQFKPQLVFIDYLNICASSRLKGMGGSVNSYSYVKAIAEELRGLGVEFDVPIVSATQTTRSGYGSSDPGLEDTSESFGLPATADLMFALITNEELEKDNQIMVKQLKNRYNDPNFNKRFLIGVNKLHMRLYDLDEVAQKEIAQEPVGRIPHISEVKDDPELLKKVAEFRF